ncbi:hypothetical protein CVT24_010456 [Panaeolus cyanescens]|uniref:Uncharacterized protein n=1 Tax=Panaeolus cyanescens TaxID=181874 RepID=A0A409X2P8_9AGAR|nr:hypothetical protein CVT24_010456 [Panaeolus cyanescens]
MFPISNSDINIIYRARRNREPRFPFGITKKTFELVESQLKELDYKGPVALSCDDTKLFSAFRLYYDAAEECHFLIGHADEPYKLRVADPTQIQEVLDASKHEMATKIRLWCLTLASPEVTPIIVAALPITDKLGAVNLFPLLRRVLDGLIDHGFRVVSYASDGTEVERKVQEMLLDLGETKQYVISNPQARRPNTVIRYTVYRGQAICIVQDSKHALKTCRNNLFSGARLLTLGNHIAAYRRIRQILDDRGPIRKRDVEKLDRQDDNAASRLFSSATLKHLVDHHKDDALGEIVYLFVFGELVDAFQNRSISHLKRIRMVLRARYFLDTWTAYLQACQYPIHRYHLSRECLAILDIVIQSMIALVIIHRDYVDGDSPLFPWLNTTEPCEHVFGCARQVVKDFTYLDFIYMVPKLRIQLREATLHSHISDSKASGAGYTHTYFDFDFQGSQLAIFAQFPSDQDILDLCPLASQEADSLWSTLGVNATQVFYRIEFLAATAKAIAAKKRSLPVPPS